MAVLFFLRVGSMAHNGQATRRETNRSMVEVASIMVRALGWASEEYLGILTLRT